MLLACVLGGKETIPKRCALRHCSAVKFSLMCNEISKIWSLSWGFFCGVCFFFEFLIFKDHHLFWYWVLFCSLKKCFLLWSNMVMMYAMLCFAFFFNIPTGKNLNWQTSISSWKLLQHLSALWNLRFWTPFLSSQCDCSPAEFRSVYKNFTALQKSPTPQLMILENLSNSLKLNHKKFSMSHLWKLHSFYLSTEGIFLKTYVSSMWLSLISKVSKRALCPL